MISGIFIGQIDPGDLGFWRGWSVFEAMEAKDKTIFHFKDHYDRLLKSCELSHISLPTLFSFDVLNKQLAISLEVEMTNRDYCEFLIKVIITQGCSKDHKTPEAEKSNWHYEILPLPNHNDKPLKLIVKQAIKSNFPEIKSTGSYHDAMILKLKAQTDGFDDFLYFHQSTGITESATANVFFVYDFHGKKVLATPADNILFGITRSIILSLSRNCDIFYSVLEMPSVLFTKNFLREAEECFLTSTTIGVKEVENITDIDGFNYRFKTGEGTLTYRLRQLFGGYREDYFQKHGV